MSLILPALILFVPIILLIVFGRKFKPDQKLKYALVFLSCFILGLFVPTLSMITSMTWLFPSDYEGVKCVTGSTFFLVAGHFINIIGLIFVGIALIPYQSTENKLIS